MDIRDFLFWETTSRDTIDFKKIYVDVAEDLIGGLLLSQIVYWHLPNKETGKTKLRVEKEGHYWIAKGREDWFEEIRITAKQYDRAIKILENKGFVEVKTFKFNSNPTKHVRLQWETFLMALEAKKEAENGFDPYSPMVIPQRVKTNLPKGEEPTSPKVKNDIDLSGRTLTENTDREYHSKITNNKYKILYSNISKVQADILRNLLRQYCFAEDEIENIIFNMDETNKIPKKEDLKFICEKMIDSNIELVAYNTIPLIHMLFETPKVTEIQTKAEPEPVVNKEVDQLLKKLFKNHIHESKRKVIHQLYKKYDGQISITDLQSILNGIGKKIHNNFDNFYYYLKTCFENYLQRENEVAATKEEEEITEEVSEEELLKLFKF